MSPHRKTWSWRFPFSINRIVSFLWHRSRLNRHSERRHRYAWTGHNEFSASEKQIVPRYIYNIRINGVHNIADKRNLDTAKTKQVKKLFSFKRPSFLLIYIFSFVPSSFLLCYFLELIGDAFVLN